MERSRRQENPHHVYWQALNMQAPDSLIQKAFNTWQKQPLLTQWQPFKSNLSKQEETCLVVIFHKWQRSFGR